MTPQETDPDLPMSVQESPVEVWVSGGLLQGWVLSVAVHAWDILKEVTIIFITSTIVWPQVNNREGTQLHPSTENWIKDLLSMTPPIRTRPISPSVSLSHQDYGYFFFKYISSYMCIFSDLTVGLSDMYNQKAVLRK